MNLLIADNNDSFTWNLYQLCREAGAANVKVVKAGLEGGRDYESAGGIILSPGPGLPTEYPGMFHILHNYYGKRILGICLGMQAIGVHFGAEMENMEKVIHGRTEKISVLQPDYIFRDAGADFEAGLYHSWVISENNFPSCLEITAAGDAGRIMAVRHKSLDIRGVQFHPESFLTPAGLKIMRNWIKG